ncbi:MAG: hypothetical protein S4CHLAM20_08130 [Chlamydiia bacterium]|nr:hypothetical protein [Chlamydiia bacterium]
MNRALIMAAIGFCGGVAPLSSNEFIESIQKKVSVKKYDIKMNVIPFMNMDIIQPVYGVSLRVQSKNHTFEFAPITQPPGKGRFGDKMPRAGFITSYSISFYPDWYVQPYFGVAYKGLEDGNYNRKVTHKNGFDTKPEDVEVMIYKMDYKFYSTLIGLKSRFEISSVSVCGFIDVFGPGNVQEITIQNNGSKKTENFFSSITSFPRVGIGIQF